MHFCDFNFRRIDRKNRDDRVRSANDQPMRALQSTDGGCTANSQRLIARVPEPIPLADSNSVATAPSSPIASRGCAVQSSSIPEPSDSARKLRSMPGFLPHGARGNPHRDQPLLPIVKSFYLFKYLPLFEII